MRSAFSPFAKGKKKNAEGSNDSSDATNGIVLFDVDESGVFSKEPAQVLQRPEFCRLENVSIVDGLCAVSDPLNDTVCLYDFDGEHFPETPTQVIQDHLSFPHDARLSPDKKMLVIANYGIEVIDNRVGSSHKCMHDLAPGRSATSVGRRCGCARARYAAVQSSVAQLTAACAGPALGGGPARRQPDQTQAADSMALTWPRTVKASGTRPRLSPMFCAGAERSLTVQPPGTGSPVTIPVSAVAGLSGSPQLLSRYRRCSLGSSPI